MTSPANMGEQDRRTWILAVVALTLAVIWGMFGGGESGATNRDGEASQAAAEAPKGRYRRVDAAKSDAQLEREALLAIGYLSGTRDASEDVAVTVNDDERTWAGLNFYTSGHGPHAFLMDMEGTELHQWTLSAQAAWPKWEGAREPTTRFWRRAFLYENGDVLAIIEGAGLIKVDRDSNLLWKQPNRAHHDLEVLANGDIWVLTRRVRGGRIVGAEGSILEDFAALLDPVGEFKKKISILEAYRRSGFNEHWELRAEHGGDVMHTNTIEVLDGTHVGLNQAFAAGNLLISMRNNDAIAVLDPETETIVWSQVGDWRKQHDPHLLANGNLLLFDNGGQSKKSKILEFAPTETGGLDLLWKYEGTDESPFWSGSCGTVQRLPNGNTLITESDAGRAFEMSPDGDVVWDFHSPHRPKDRPKMVATLFENLRLPPDFPTEWARSE